MMNDTMRRATAILGSSRRYGNTGDLLDVIAAKLELEVVDLGAADISPYDYEHKNMEDDFLPILDRMLQHDEVFFASPVYWYSMSAQMKIFFDRLSDLLSVEELKGQGRALRGKRAHVISTSINPVSGRGFDEAFQNTFGYLGMVKGSCLHVDCSSGFDAADCDPSIQKFLAAVSSTA